MNTPDPTPVCLETMKGLFSSREILLKQRGKLMAEQCMWKLYQEHWNMLTEEIATIDCRIDQLQRQSTE